MLVGAAAMIMRRYTLPVLTTGWSRNRGPIISLAGQLGGSNDEISPRLRPLDRNRVINRSV